MTTGKRRAISTPGGRRDPARRGPIVVILSVATHVAAVLLLWRVIVAPLDWRTVTPNSEPVMVERIGFLAIPKRTTPSTERARSGGNDRPMTKLSVVQTAPPPIVAPSIIPRTLPDLPRPFTQPQEAAGSGPLVGIGGPLRGVRPSFTDPRVWAPTAPILRAPMSPAQRLDSVLAASLGAMNDSLRNLPTEREPGDWTVERNGRKYGIDGKYIRLGKFALPTAALALLPLNVQGNPQQMETSRRIGTMRSEILEQAARGARDDEFHAAVKALRERKDKERAARKAPDATVTPTRP